MASEQLEPQCHSCCHHHHPPSRRAPDHAATAALYATRPERKASVVEPAVSEYRLMNTKDTGSGTLANHAAAGAIIAHSRSRSYTDRKGKQRATERSPSLVQDQHDVEAPHRGQYSQEGFKAATSAVKESRAAAAVSPSPLGVPCDNPGRQDDEHHTIDHERALRAASGAFVNSRKRAESIPPPKPRARPAAPISAASAADAIRRSQRGDEEMLSLPEISGSDAVQLHHAAKESARHTVSEPLFKPEEQDKRNVERAAALSLARDMEDPSKKRDELPSMHGARGDVDRSRSKRLTVSDPAAVQRAILLQYAAESRAADRIAEMQDEPSGYQQYYGTDPPSRQPRSRLSLRRKRTPSVGDTSMVDAERSLEIRNQMSTLQTKLNEVDEQKQKDRDQLMDAARKNVDAAIREMELQIYAETGRAPTSLQKDLGEGATERAEGDTEARLGYVDMVDLGAGQRMDPDELEATARSRVQPALHEMDDQVEEHRARELEERLDKDEKMRREELDREREASIQAAMKEKGERPTSPSAEPAKQPKTVTRTGLFGKMHNRAEEQRARKAEERLDRDERKRHKTMEREREADTRAEEHRLIAAERDEQRKRWSWRSKPSEEKERPAQREQPAEREPAAATAESRVEAEPSSQEDVLPEMTRSQTAQREGGVVAAAPAEAAPREPSPTTGAKLRAWLRDRMGRKAPEFAQEPSKTPREEMESTPRPAEGAAAVSEGDSRGAALSSHPVTGDDLAQMQNGDRRPSMAESLARRHSTRRRSTRQNPAENGASDRPGTRTNLMRIVTRSADSHEREPATNGVASGSDSDTSSARTEREAETEAPGGTHHDAHNHGAEHPAPTERGDLRESAAEQGLPVPPAVGERGSHSSAARESRFSEDL